MGRRQPTLSIMSSICSFVSASFTLMHNARIERRSHARHVAEQESPLATRHDELHRAAEISAARARQRVHLGHRLAPPPAAESYFSGSLLAGFLSAHPQVRLDLAVSEAPLDIVAEGYDAGVRLGEVIDRDMIAVPVSGDIRLIVVA